MNTPRFKPGDKVQWKTDPLHRDRPCLLTIEEGPFMPGVTMADQSAAQWKDFSYVVSGAGYPRLLCENDILALAVEWELCPGEHRMVTGHWERAKP